MIKLLLLVLVPKVEELIVLVQLSAEVLFRGYLRFVTMAAALAAANFNQRRITLKTHLFVPWTLLGLVLNSYFSYRVFLGLTPVIGLNRCVRTCLSSLRY